jgi:hypothetical protein
MAIRLSALCVGRPLPPGRFLILISVRIDPRAKVLLDELGKLKIHLIGTRTRDLPACSIVPQPTTLPRAPYFGYKGRYNQFQSDDFYSEIKLTHLNI